MALAERPTDQNLCHAESIATLLQELVKRRISTFAMHSGLSEDDFGWGSPTFHKMVMQLSPCPEPACLNHHLMLRPRSCALCRPQSCETRSAEVSGVRPVQGREKIHLIETFTDMGFDILVSDVDTVW